MKNILFGIVLIFLSCNNSNPRNKNIPKNSNASLSLTHNITIKKAVDQGFQKIIKGRWCDLNDTTSLFSIDKNEIYYYDALAFYKYKVANDTITIIYPDYRYSSIVKMLGRDTLIMIGIGKFNGNIDTLHRCSY